MKLKRLVPMVVMAGFALSGCSIKPQPPLKLVEINPQIKVINHPSERASISVNYSSCTGVFDTYSVYVQTAHYQLEALSNYNWVDTPCNMIKISLEKALEKNGFSVNNLSKNWVTFELIEFKPVFEKTRYCKLSVLVSANLKGRKGSFLFQKELPITKGNFVSCLNRLTQEFDRFCVIWLEKQFGSISK